MSLGFADTGLGLSEIAGEHLVDPRTGGNGRHGLTGLFRRSTFGRLGGYEDVNDADRLGRDPAMRWIVGGRAVAKQAASASQMGCFETEFLATDANISALTELSGAWIDRVHDRKPPKGVVLDMDSSVSPTNGNQEGTAYNGHKAERVITFYKERGTAEQWIKESKNAINWTRLSCYKLRNNEVRLQFPTLAYNLANFMRTLALSKEVEHWSLTTIREKLINVGAKVVAHGRYVTFQMAEVAVPRDLFRRHLGLIDRLRRPIPATAWTEGTRDDSGRGVSERGEREPNWSRKTPGR